MMLAATPISATAKIRPTIRMPGCSRAPGDGQDVVEAHADVGDRHGPGGTSEALGGPQAGMLVADDLLEPQLSPSW